MSLEFGSPVPEEELIDQEPTMIEAGDFGVQYHLPEFELEPRSLPKFHADPEANFEFSEEAADAIAKMPAWEEENNSWRRLTEGPRHLEAGQTFAERLQERADRLVDTGSRLKNTLGRGLEYTSRTAKTLGRTSKDIVTSKGFKRVVFATGLAGLAVGMGAGVLNGDHDNGHNHNGHDQGADNDLDGDHHDYVVSSGANMAHAAEIHGVQQLPLMDFQDAEEDPEIVDPTNGGKRIFLTIVADEVDFDELPEPVKVDPEPEPDRADVGFDDDDAPIGLSSSSPIYPGEKAQVAFPPVENNGPDKATNVRLNVRIPPGADFDPSETDLECDVLVPPLDPSAEEAISCVVGEDGELDPNESTEELQMVGIEINADQKPGGVMLEAEVEADEIDPNEDNNTTNAGVSVEKRPDPVVKVDGVVFDMPDSKVGDWRTVGGNEFPYLCSVENEDGKTIDAFRVVDTETGEVMAEYTNDGTMVIGDRDFTPNDACEPRILYQDEFDIPDNEYDRPMIYRHPIGNGVHAEGAITVSLSADMLMQDGAGLRLERGIEMEDTQGLLGSHEQLTIENRGGVATLLIDKGFKAWVNDWDGNDLELPEVFPLGPMSGDVTLHTTENDVEGHDFLWVSVGGEMYGPYVVMKINETDEAPIVHASVLIPPGTGHGVAELEVEKRPDYVMEGRDLHNVDNRLKEHRGIESSDSPGVRISFGIDSSVGSQAFNQVLYPEEYGNLLEHHFDGWVITNNYEDTMAEEMDMLPVTPQDQAEFIIENGGNPISLVSTALSHDEVHEIFGNKSEISPRDLNQSAAKKVMLRKLRAGIDRAVAAHNAGGEAHLTLQGHNNAGLSSNTWIWLREAGASIRARDSKYGDFGKLSEFILSEIQADVAERYPDFPIKELRVSSATPDNGSLTTLYLGTEGFKMADFARQTVGTPLRQVDITDTYFGRGHAFSWGQQYRLNPETAPDNLRSLLLKHVSDLQDNNPNIDTIGIRNIGGVWLERETPEQLEGYYQMFIDVAEEVHALTGMNFELQFIAGLGDRSEEAAPFDGPFFNNGGQEWGLHRGLGTEAVFNGFESDPGEVVLD